MRQRIEVRLKDLFMDIANVATRMCVENGEAYSRPVADGTLWANVEIRVPNATISGDYRCVTAMVRFGLLDFEVKPGDVVEEPRDE